MDERREKPGWAFWLIMALVALPVLYALSFGPVCRGLRHSGEYQRAYAIYSPLFRVAEFTGWQWPVDLMRLYGGPGAVELIELHGVLGSRWIEER